MRVGAHQPGPKHAPRDKGAVASHSDTYQLPELALVLSTHNLDPILLARYGKLELVGCPVELLSERTMTTRRLQRL